MRKLMMGFMLAVTGGSVGLAQTNFYTNVTNLWYQGGEHRTNVLTIANARLAANTNDIAGLILKAEYHFEFLEASHISNAFLRVIQVGDTITTPNFVQRYQELSRERILAILDDLAEDPLTDAEIQREKHKALIPHKPLPSSRLIEALLQDGYFN